LALHATEVFSRALNLAARVFFFSLSPFCCFPCAISAADSNLDLNALELTLHQFKRLADPFFFRRRRINPRLSFLSFAFAFGCKRKDINAERELAKPSAAHSPKPPYCCQEKTAA